MKTQSKNSLKRLNLVNANDVLKKVAPKPTTIQDDIASQRVEQKLKAAQRTEKKYTQLLEKTLLEEEIAGDFKRCVANAYTSGKFTVNIRKSKPTPITKDTEDCVLVISDSHAGKIIQPRQVNDMESYNPREFVKRAATLESTVINLKTQHIKADIGKLYVLFLGDLVEGGLDHASEVPMRELLADQVHLAAMIFFQMVARLSVYFNKVECYGVGGNHGRWQNQRKVSSENTFSNFDFIVMSWVQSLIETAKLPNVKFYLDENIFPIVTIQGWPFKIGHGSHLKGGDKACGIPAHAIGREINSTTQKHSSRGTPVPWHYIVGDKHRAMEIPTALGSYLVNGAWFGDDGYGAMQNFLPCRPFQRLFGVHRSVGITYQYNLWLKKEKQVEIPYSLPERLEKYL